VLQHRALLDVQLHVGGDLVRRPRRLPHPFGIEADGSQGVGQGIALEVRRRAHVVGAQAAGHGPRAQAADEAPLLVGEGDGLEGARQIEPGLGDGARALERRQHPQGAVQGPAVGHGIDMRAREHALAARAQPADDVSRRVAAHLQAGIGHALCQPRPRLFEGRRKRGPHEAARVRSADPRQLLDIAPQARQVDPQLVHHTTENSRGSLVKTSLPVSVTRMVALKPMPNSR
jgi:hypothetical protein